MASCPAFWFKFGEHDCKIQNYGEPVPDCDLLIYGGGTMMNWLHGRQLPAYRKVAWGIGSSRHGQRDPWPDPTGFELLGIREWTIRDEVQGRWAPCASCMSSLFSADYVIEHEAVFFLNGCASIRARYPIHTGEVPTMTNRARMDEIVKFLGSAKRVITDSYHGVYWATLLGREVVCVPYSSKFLWFKHPPLITDGANAINIRKARAYPEALEECRRATMEFYDRVMDL